MMKWRISLVIEPDEDEFHGYCPFLKGLHVPGATKEEALMHLGDALSAYMESVVNHNDFLDFDKVCTLNMDELIEGLDIRVEELGYTPEEIEADIEDAIRAVREDEMEA